MEPKPNPEKEEKREEKKSRVDSVHGGTLVQAISKEDLVSVNDADCKHNFSIRLDDDGDFTTMGCTNPNCSEVVLYNKS